MFALWVIRPQSIRTERLHRDQNAKGGAKLLANDSLLLAYRIVLHAGNAEQAEIARIYSDYAQTTIDPFANIVP